MERLSPEEYQRLENITPATEDLRQHGLLPDALEEQADLELRSEEVIPDNENRRKLNETLLRENISLDSDLPEDLEGREKIASELYKEITYLLKGHLAPWYGETAKKIEALWDDLGNEWEAHNTGHVMESELVIKIGQAIQKLRIFRQQIIDRKER